jgi:hypothetical protein
MEAKTAAFRTCLHHMKHALDACGQEFFLCCGTLLGCVRDKTFIPHDDDIDIGVFARKFDPHCVHTILASGRFRLLRQLGRLEDSLELTFQHANGVHIDLFVFYPLPEKGQYYLPSFFGLCDDKPGGFCKWCRPIQGLVSMEFVGAEFLVPINATEHLEASYGPDWQVPKRFSYWEGLSGQYKNLM